MLQNGFFNLSKITSKFLYFLVMFLLISSSFVLHTQNVQAQTYTIWPCTARPVISSVYRRAAVELGVKFRSDLNGYITGIRFYKGRYNTGTHIGKLWTRTGTLLAQATITNESASGWQQVYFAEPVQITANTVYVASYYAPKGRYAVNYRYFARAGVDNGPLHALKNGVSGGNGVYLYGSGGFPTRTSGSKNYWVDVVFTTTGSGSKVTLAWDPPTDTSNVVGYKLYYGTSSNNYTYSKIVGNVTQDTITFPQSGVTYYIAAVSCDTCNCGPGHESPYSNEVTFPSQQIATNLDTIETGPNASDTDRNGLTNLTDTDSDNDGFVDGLEVLTGSNPEDSLSTPQLADVMEAGEVSVDHNWIKVTLTKTYVNPVVVAKIITYHEDDPAVIRIRNVDSTGFEIRIQDWQYPDDIHSTESVSYTVIERGTYILDDGTMVEAGMVDTDSASTFKKISFNKTFTSIPVVITTVSTFNNEEPVTAKVKEIKTGEFKLSLAKQKNNSQELEVEMVSYIAWEVSSGILNNMIFEVKKTPNKLGTNFRNIQFTETVTNTPVLLADMQTTHGDNANLRCQNLDIYGVDMKIHKEQSRGKEISEVGGYILVSPVDAQ